MTNKFKFNFDFLKKKKNESEIEISSEETIENPIDEANVPPMEIEETQSSPSFFAKLIAKFKSLFAKKSSIENAEEDFNFSEALEMPKPDRPKRGFDQLDSLPEDENDYSQDSEEFAEKTLSGYRLPPKEEIVNPAYVKLLKEDSEEYLNSLKENNSEIDNQTVSHPGIENPVLEEISETIIENEDKEEKEVRTSDPLEANLPFEVSHDDYDLSEKTQDGIIISEMTALPPEKPEEIKKFRFNFSSWKDKGFGSFSALKLKNSAKDFKFEKISWNDLVLRFFSPYTRGKIHKAFTVLLVFSLTYVFGKSLAVFFNRGTKVDTSPKSTIVMKPMNQENLSGDINKISAVNLFNIKESEEIKNQKSNINIDEIICSTADRPTGAQLKLLDTVVLQDSVKSVASVQVRGDSELLNVREGEKLQDAGVEVSRISRMQLILKNLTTGDCEYLKTEDDETSIMPEIKIHKPSERSKFISSNPNIKNTGNQFKIKKTYRDSLVNNMSEILTQAKAVQITNPDGSLCFKMTEVVPGSIYTNLNIQENDIVCSLNGRKIDNLNELMNLLGRIKEIDQMQIGLKRNGMNENLDFNFE